MCKTKYTMIVQRLSFISFHITEAYKLNVYASVIKLF